jgi:hypothetical protein
MKEVYARLRKLDAPGFRHRNSDMKHWRRLATTLQQRGVHGPHYILWAYPYLRTRSKNIYIQVITSSKYVDEHMRQLAGASARKEELQVKLRIQSRIVKRELQLKRDLRDILLDRDLDLGVVFRYACASSAGLDDVVDVLRTEAEHEMALEPLYNELLPPSGTGGNGITP